MAAFGLTILDGSDRIGQVRSTGFATLERLLNWIPACLSASRMTAPCLMSKYVPEVKVEVEVDCKTLPKIRIFRDRFASGSVRNKMDAFGFECTPFISLFHWPLVE